MTIGRNVAPAVALAELQQRKLFGMSGYRLELCPWTSPPINMGQIVTEVGNFRI
jgi:hypothetical protein